MTRGAKVTVKCKCCNKPFEARVADRKRGWALYCSKSCKAKKQTNNTVRKAKSLYPWQRYDKCTTHEQRETLLRNPRVIEVYEDGTELFYANFSNEEGTDI